MARILLINPSYFGSYSNTKAGLTNPVHPTLGLAAIAGSALAGGHQVEILDLSAKPYDFSLIRDRIMATRPDIVGATVTTPLMNQVRDISLLVKDISSDISVVAGGPHVSALYHESMKESALDAVFVGEADDSFVEYCDGRDPSTIKGICYNDNGEPRFTGPRLPISDLDTLPMPAWHLYEAENYRGIARIYARRSPMAMVEFSRGCVFKCDFCASKVSMALGYRKKSPERCAEEVRQLVQLGFREFKLADDIFTSDQKWSGSVSDAIAAENLDIIWTATNGIRVESADSELFAKMRRAGCYGITFGLETGNDKVLKAFGKGGKASIQQARQAVEKANVAQLETLGSFMLGLSADTEETMMETIEFARSLPVYSAKVSVTIAFPGTPMFDKGVREGMIRSYNWDDYFMYSSEPLYHHPRIDYSTILQYTKIFYRRAVFFNHRFWWQRFKWGMRTGNLFRDAYYFVKFILLSSTGRPLSTEYFARDRWPVWDFLMNKPQPAQYQVVGRRVAAGGDD